MRKRNKVAQLSMVSGQRKALLISLANGLFETGKIKTTLAKAKALRGLVEKKISLAKSGLAEEKRIVKTRTLRKFFSEKTVKEIFVWAEVFKDRAGGYCRIIKLPFRQSDSAPMALIEMVQSLPEKEAAQEKKSLKAEKRENKKQPAKKQEQVLKDKPAKADEK